MTPKKVTPQQKILRERARRLARRPEGEAAEEDLLQIVGFTLAGESYGVESHLVSEVFGLQEVAHVPCTPDFVLGIINIRGRIVSVVDLRVVFGMEARPLSGAARAIVLASRDMEFALAAESVRGIRGLPAAALQPPLPTLTGAKRDYTRGVTGEGLILIDVGKMLSDPGLLVDETVA